MNIHFATMTGNAEALADEGAARLTAAGITAASKNMSKSTAAQLAAEETALYVVSTWGDGEAPDDAMDLWNALESANAPAMTGVRYAVFGLGDSSYPEFNAFARKLDDRLAELGGRRLEDRFEADLDYQDDFEAWINRMQKILHVLKRSTTPAHA